MKFYDIVESQGVSAAYLSYDGWGLYVVMCVVLDLFLLGGLVYYDKKALSGAESHDAHVSSFIFSIIAAPLICHLGLMLIFNINLSKDGAKSQIEKTISSRNHTGHCNVI